MPSELTVTVPPARAAVDPGTPPPARTHRSLLIALAAAWLIPAAAYPLHLTWLLPPLVLLATASLLRGGRTLLDRLLLGALLLVGTTTVAGLLFTVWPWGLHPVAVNGAALTALTLIAAATGRRPTLPRPGWTDLLPIIAAAATVGYLAQPWLRAGTLAGRLSLLALGEDNFRHVALVDAIGRLGGYAFLDPAGSRDHIVSLLARYPQGWHLTTALLDTQLRSATGTPSGVSSLTHYGWWCLATFGLLTLTLFWAAQRLPGPLHPLHRGVLTIVVGALVLGSQMPRLLIAGYPSEVLGLALAVALAALVVRPLAGNREQLVLLAALLIGIGFTYYLFLPPAGLLVLGWLIAHRRELSQIRRTLLAVGLVTALLAPLPLLVGVLGDSQTEALDAKAGPELAEAWRALLGLTPIVLIALVIQARRADRAWRRHLAAVLVAVGFALAIALANVLTGVQPAYYFMKGTHLATGLLIVGTAALVRLLPVPSGADRRDRIRAAAPAVLAAALAVLTVVTLCGLTGWRGSLLVVDKQSWTWLLVQHNVDKPSRVARVCAAAYRRHPVQQGTVTVVLDRTAYRGYAESICLSALQASTAQTEQAIYLPVFEEPERTRKIMRETSGPIRLLVSDPAAQGRVDSLLTRYPELRSRVTTVPMIIKY
ncbi:hypothetical protein AB0B57_24240 [Micromonospora sp. NPDC049101]|uniref:hypothetical protein n=1 Tax=Micromonospora sp. NPDC049101 TaxID=3155032 RepID=UPI0033BFC73E